MHRSLTLPAGTANQVEHEDKFNSGLGLATPSAASPVTATLTDCRGRTECTLDLGYEIRKETTFTGMAIDSRVPFGLNLDLRCVRLLCPLWEGNLHNIQC